MPQHVHHEEDYEPRRHKYLSLFRSEDIFSDISGLENELVGNLKASSVNKVMLDNATVDYALSVLALGTYDWWKPVLPSRTDVYAYAVFQLMDALVLYDDIIVGPGGAGTRYTRDDVKATQRILKDAAGSFSTKALFGLANLARNAAKEAILSHDGLSDAFQEMTSAELDLAEVARFIDQMVPEFASHSPHYYADLSPEEEEEFCLDNVVWGALGTNRIAMDAIDEDNRGRSWSTDQYFGILAKRRGGLNFPEREYHEFYAAALLIRSFFYLFTCELTGCSYYSDAYRAPLIKALLAGGKRMKKKFAEVVLKDFGEDEIRRDEVLNNALGFDAFKMTTPLVASAVLQKARGLEEVLPIALEVRSSRRATDFRRYCAEVDQAIQRGDRKRVEEAFRDLAAMGIEVVQGIETPKSPSAPVQTAKELASYGSPLIKVIWPLLANPVERLYKRIRYRRLAFIHDLRELPRILTPVEKKLRELTRAA